MNEIVFFLFFLTNIWIIHAKHLGAGAQEDQNNLQTSKN